MNKTPQKQNAKFSQTMPRHAYQDDEISLVDLAKIVVKRRNWLFAVFAIGVVITLLAAWLKRPMPIIVHSDKAFTTLIAVGYKTPSVFIEPLLGVQTQLKDAFIPQASFSNNFNTQVVIDEPLNQSNIIKLVTVADLSLKKEVTTYHKAILEPLLDRHQILVAEIKSNMSEKSDLQPIVTNVSVLAQPLEISEQTSKTKTSLIVALGLILSAMLAVVVVFIREFASQVCNSLRVDLE